MSGKIFSLSTLVASLAIQVSSGFTTSVHVHAANSRLFSSTETEADVLEITLSKPLGMVLEEVEEGKAKGVFVLEVGEEGSAASSEFKDQMVGRIVTTVMGEDVTQMVFDDVMDKLIRAPSPVSLQLAPQGGVGEKPQYDVGTIVEIKVVEDGRETAIEAKVGDNLRKILLENNIEVYKGLKKKLGNCGGGGQCTFCATDFIESAGWGPRSEYEDQKLKNAPTSRLTCLNNIQGPATIRF